MIETAHKNDLLTVAALGLIAMCLVTFDHEALGHGGACLLLGGHIRLLTSSIFRCSTSSGWIDASGPITNLSCGLMALILCVAIPTRLYRARLFLALLTAFSWFWESGYVIHAMHREDGDLYSFASYRLGHVTVTERWIFAALGLALYVTTIRLTSNTLLTINQSAQQSRVTARTAWIAGTLGATLAGSLGPSSGGLRDAILEVGLASLPLLFIPHRDQPFENLHQNAAIARSPFLIAVAIVVFAVFAATLGHGLRLLL